MLCCIVLFKNNNNTTKLGAIAMPTKPTYKKNMKIWILFLEQLPRALCASLQNTWLAVSHHCPISICKRSNVQKKNLFMLYLYFRLIHKRCLPLRHHCFTSQNKLYLLLSTLPSNIALSSQTKTIGKSVSTLWDERKEDGTSWSFSRARARGGCDDDYRNRFCCSNKRGC